jgi:hypothetical protein
MADDNEMSVADVAVENAPQADAPVEKKQRAPRRSKIEIAEAKAASASKPEKSPKAKAVRQKRGANTAAKTLTVNAKTAGDAPESDSFTSAAKSDVVEQSAPASYLPAMASDEMADLIALEEENQKLRKTLAEKLRAENADLRKRLEKY